MRFSAIRFLPIGEVVLFVLTAGLLTYLSNTGRWWAFVPALVLATLLFAALSLMNHRPLRERIEALQNQEFVLSTRFESVGIVALYDMADLEQQHERNRRTRDILQRGNVFSLCSLTAASYVHPGVARHWDALEERLDTGSTLRLLLLDPFCAEKELRDRLNEVGRPFDSKLDVGNLIGLHNRYERVTIRLASHSLYGAVFSSEEEMMYDPYHLGKVAARIENRFFAMELTRWIAGDRKRPAPYYALLQAHFDALWQTATSLEEFVAGNEARLQRGADYAALIVPRYRPAEDRHG